MAAAMGMGAGGAAVTMPLRGYEPGRHNVHKPKQNATGSKFQKACENGRVGLTQPCLGYGVLPRVSISPKKDIGKGPARTLSQRDYKLTMAHGRHYRRRASNERFTYLMGSI